MITKHERNELPIAGLNSAAAKDDQRGFLPDLLLAEALKRTDGQRNQARFDPAALEALCTSFNTDTGLNFRGRQRAKTLIVEALVKNIRLTQILARHPRIAELPLPGPVIIVAPFRSGTTFLHRLLANDPGLRWTRTWEVSTAPTDSIIKQDDPDYLRDTHRSAWVQRSLDAMQRWNPELSTIHATGANFPEECYGLLESSLLSHSFMFYGRVESYFQWLENCTEEQWLEAYRLYADQLRVLQWQMPGRRWLLKSPVHLWNLDALMNIFPDAHVVQTYRDPLEVVPSFCSLLIANHQALSSTVDVPGVAAWALGYLCRAVERGVISRRHFPQENFTDLHCDALWEDQMGAIKLLYNRSGMKLTPDTVLRMETWLKQQNNDSSPHNYSLDRFKLNKQSIIDGFAPYQIQNASRVEPNRW